MRDRVAYPVLAVSGMGCGFCGPAVRGWPSMQISEFPTGDFGSNRQAVSVETDRPFRSKAAPRCGWVLVPTLANRRCVIHPILLWSAKASTLVIIYSF